jgi:hypothetical protein
VATIGCKIKQCTQPKEEEALQEDWMVIAHDLETQLFGPQPVGLGN